MQHLTKVGSKKAILEVKARFKMRIVSGKLNWCCDSLAGSLLRETVDCIQVNQALHMIMMAELSIASFHSNSIYSTAASDRLAIYLLRIAATRGDK